jgi:Domain of Unknown Function (DUF1080)
MRLLPRSLLIFSLLSAAWAVPVATAAAAQNNGHKAAITLDDVDDDFWFQGEYYGLLSIDSGRGTQFTGLQVVALGDGHFTAIEYPGGLPGFGWYDSAKAEKIVLIGHKEGNQVFLNYDDHRYVITNGVATTSFIGAQTRGALTKVNRISRTMGQAPPPTALILFDGNSTNNLVNARLSSDGLLKEGAVTRLPYRDYLLHVEFQLPYMPYARGQARGNSGIYLQERYEVQILDSFGLEGRDNECGAIYRYQAPALNVCLPPLAWQTYDIVFRNPRFGLSGEKVEDALVTVWQNGFPVQSRIEVTDPTGNGKPEGPVRLPILFQNHGNPVRFRNIWLMELPGGRGIYSPVFPAATPRYSVTAPGAWPRFPTE